MAEAMLCEKSGFYPWTEEGCGRGSDLNLMENFDFRTGVWTPPPRPSPRNWNFSWTTLTMWRPRSFPQCMLLIWCVLFTNPSVSLAWGIRGSLHYTWVPHKITPDLSKLVSSFLRSINYCRPWFLPSGLVETINSSLGHSNVISMGNITRKPVHSNCCCWTFLMCDFFVTTESFITQYFGLDSIAVITRVRINSTYWLRQHQVCHIWEWM